MQGRISYPVTLRSPMPRDYRSARANFLCAAEEARQEVVSIAHPLAAPDGEPLFVDVVRIGRNDAPRLLVLTSGVHGVELYPGSLCQADFLRSAVGETLPEDVAVLLIHAINPWGAANHRRVTENNVDLCRNFLCFEAPLPVNTAHAQFVDVLQCDVPAGPLAEAADKQLDAMRAEMGLSAFMSGLVGGQYQYPELLAFGGTAPEWSNLVMTGLLQDHAAHAQRVSLLDYHTGLGPYGYGLVITLQGDDAVARARSAYGHWLSEIEPSAEIPDRFFVAHGHTTRGYESALPDRALTSVIVEFGTFEEQIILQQLVTEDRMQRATALDPADRARLQARFLETFSPSDPEWAIAVQDRGRQVARQALAVLALA